MQPTPSMSKTRKIVQVTCLPALYKQIQEYCKSIDVPVSVWARELIIQELERCTRDNM